MTITFLAPDGVAVTAQQERQANAAFFGGGAGRPLGGRSGFRVDTASNILTATSTIWTLTPCAAFIDPGATTNQGMYGWATDANVTGTMTAADATYTHIDIVYILVNDSSAGDGSGALNANPVYVAGAATASPVAPTLPPRSFLVGTITVPKVGAGSPTVVLNPARSVAAGAPLPVASQAERDALSLYPGLQVMRTDQSCRIETYNGTAWSHIGQTWSFDRGAGSDSTFTSANTGLVSGVITTAPAGTYRIEGMAGLYGASSAVGRVFVGTGPSGSTVYYKRRQDLTGTPSTYPALKPDFAHPGGNLTITVGYDVVSGSAAVMSAASGETTVTATFLGS